MADTRSYSIRMLLRLLALAIVVPAALASAGLIAWNVAEARKAREDQLLTSARMTSSAVDAHVARLAIAAEALASSDALRAEDWTALRRRLDRLDIGPDAWMVVTDVAGRRLVNTATGAQGRAHGLPRPADIVRALETGRPTISNLFTGTASARPVVAVNAPVEADPEGRVVTLVLEAQGFTRLLDDFPATDGVFTVTLVDRGQVVVARTRRHEAFVGKLATPGMREAMRRASTGVVPSRSLDGEKTIVAYTRSALTGWTTMVVIPRADVVRPIAFNALVLAGGTFAVLALGLLVANALARALTVDLARLEADAVRLGEGRSVPLRPSPLTQLNTVQSAMAEAGDELGRRAERQTLMIHELNHRVKNTLATVQALALQTFRSNAADATTRFDQRLQALARSHDLLIQAEWKAVDVADVAARCAESHGEGRVRSCGPTVPLPAHAAQALCMCLHELSTNSLKYGALSVPTGAVTLAWRPAPDGGIDLEWREAGGPAVTAPTRTGFGTRLMDRLARTELGGSWSRDYAPSGLVARARFRLTEGERWRSDFDASVGQPPTAK